MRFEIGRGGGFVVLVGLLVLSGAVFLLGMISERKIAQSEQGQSQHVSIYPMPNGAGAATPSQADELAQPPAAPVAAATPKSPLQAAVASENISPAARAKPAQEYKAPPHLALASVPPARRPTTAGGRDDSAAPGDETGTDVEHGAVRAPPPRAATRHRGYKIVIDAAMDPAAAERMASRLLAVGYTSRIVQSQIDGQTWYRLQVGPYPTSAAAQAAEANLHAAYTARYINPAGAAADAGPARPEAGPSASSASSTDTDTSDSGAADTDNGEDRDNAPSP